MDAKSLVFEYFFQIGSGLAAGIACVILPCLLVIRLIAAKLRSKKGGELH
ncbi:hypothetical protein ABEO98_21625 [Brevibacillus parabrevis]|nr:hypothetical protein [Brevibacillus parabrevis]